MYKKCVFLSMVIILIYDAHIQLKPEYTKELNLLETTDFKKMDNLKYILFWSDPHWFYWKSEGQALFLRNMCAVKTCYMTSNRNLFGGDLWTFDAVIFYGPHLKHLKNSKDLPMQRYSHQKYIYLDKESPVNYPECSTKFNGFYNWTATYKLDSDVQLRYLTVRDIYDEVVAPTIQSDWLFENNTVRQQNDIMNEIKTKTKAAAWFVSHCYTPSRREVFVKQLQNELRKYNLDVDIYGECGNLTCAKNDVNCSSILKRDYFFYLALENSLSEDYVTEKVLHAFNNNVVPVVYGGADYKRFLPPGSYLDASTIPPAALAVMMNVIIHDHQQYAQFFWWRSYYKIYDTFSNGFAEASCDLCALLHDATKVNESFAYEDFRNWWSPKYKYDCGRRRW